MLAAEMNSAWKQAGEIEKCEMKQTKNKRWQTTIAFLQFEALQSEFPSSFVYVIIKK